MHSTLYSGQQTFSLGGDSSTGFVRPAGEEGFRRNDRMSVTAHFLFPFCLFLIHESTLYCSSEDNPFCSSWGMSVTVRMPSRPLHDESRSKTSLPSLIASSTCIGSELFEVSRCSGWRFVQASWSSLSFGMLLLWQDG